MTHEIVPGRSRISDYEQPGWSDGYREGNAEREALATENDRLRHDLAVTQTRCINLAEECDDLRTSYEAALRANRELRTARDPE